MVACAVHAAGESVMTAPIPSGTIAVALAARDELHLSDVADSLDAAGIAITRIVEANQLQAIGVHPTTHRDRVRRVVSSLPLVR